MQMPRQVPTRSPLTGPFSQVRPVLIPIALLGIAIIAWFVFQFQVRGMILPMIGLSLASFGLLVFIRPAIGLVALLITTTLVRFSLSTGTDSPIVISLACAAVLMVGWIGHNLLHRKRLAYLPGWIVIPALLFIALTLFAFGWSRIDSDPRIVIAEGFWRVQTAQWMLIAVSIGLLFVGADLFRDRGLRNLVVATILAVGVLGLIENIPSIYFSFLNTFGLFGVWFVALAWAHALANRLLPDLVRVLLGAGALLWILFALLFARTWVTGWLPPLAAMLLVTLIVHPRIGTVLLAGFTIFFATRIGSILAAEHIEGSLGGETGRLEIWAHNLSFVRERFVFGMGPAGYHQYYQTFSPDHPAALSTHNNYLDILAQAGIFGLVTFAVLLLGLLVIGLRTVLSLRWSPVDFATGAAAVGGLIALFGALMLGDWLIPYAYNQTIAGFDHAVYSWLMLAVLCGIIAQERGLHVEDRR